MGFRLHVLGELRYLGAVLCAVNKERGLGSGRQINVILVRQRAQTPCLSLTCRLMVRLPHFSKRPGSQLYKGDENSSSFMSYYDNGQKRYLAQCLA